MILKSRPLSFRQWKGPQLKNSQCTLIKKKKCLPEQSSYLFLKQEQTLAEVRLAVTNMENSLA